MTTHTSARCPMSTSCRVATVRRFVTICAATDACGRITSWSPVGTNGRNRRRRACILMARSLPLPGNSGGMEGDEFHRAAAAEEHKVKQAFSILTNTIDGLLDAPGVITTGCATVASTRTSGSRRRHPCIRRRKSRKCGCHLRRFYRPVVHPGPGRQVRTCRRSTIPTTPGAASSRSETVPASNEDSNITTSLAQSGLFSILVRIRIRPFFRIAYRSVLSNDSIQYPCTDDSWQLRLTVDEEVPGIDRTGGNRDNRDGSTLLAPVQMTSEFNVDSAESIRHTEIVMRASPFESHNPPLYDVTVPPFFAPSQRVPTCNVANSFKQPRPPRSALGHSLISGGLPRAHRLPTRPPFDCGTTTTQPTS